MIRLGAFGQLTTGSVTGLFGEDIAAFSEELVAKRLVHVIASDAHNTRGRPPVMSEAIARLSSWVGDDLARRMADELPPCVHRGARPELPAAPEARVATPHAARSPISPGLTRTVAASRLRRAARNRGLMSSARVHSRCASSFFPGR